MNVLAINFRTKFGRRVYLTTDFKSKTKQFPCSEESQFQVELVSNLAHSSSLAQASKLLFFLVLLDLMQFGFLSCGGRLISI